MQKGTAFRCSFEFWDADGMHVTSSPAVTALISKDGGEFVPITNQPATASASVPYILTSMFTTGETDADCFIVTCTIAPSSVSTQTQTFYPEANWTQEKSAYLDRALSSRMATGAVTVGTIQTDVIKADSIESNAFDSDKFTAAAIAKIQAGLALSGTALSTTTWTPTIAANLDVPISSRAASSIWTQAKADNLDAPIGSRAASSTALSNATWTPTLASNLDAPISSRAASSIWNQAKADLLDVSVGSRAASSDWTVARATKIDNIDAPITSRAASSIWTQAKADLIDVPIGSRAASATALSSSIWTAALTGVINSNTVSLTTATLSAIAQEILTLDWTTVSGEASRSVLNALRSLRNAVNMAGTTVTVYKEDDTTPAWTAAVSGNPDANPITEFNPN